jgi:CheY-like chemotaxis protein
MEKKKILIIDDEVGFTRMVKLNLEGTGNYSVRIENQGILGFDAAKEFRPDLILLDIIMPDMEGSEVAAKLRDDEATRNIPVVFLTAVVTREETEAEGNFVGGNTFLAKPVSMKVLITCIEEKL